MSIDSFTSVSADHPARASFAVTPNDSTELAVIPRAVYVGNGGNIVGQLVGDNADRTFIGVPNGAILPFRFKLIKSTSTTASDIIGLV
jgi:hypothetical protein